VAGRHPLFLLSAQIAQCILQRVLGSRDIRRVRGTIRVGAVLHLIDLAACRGRRGRRVRIRRVKGVVVKPLTYNRKWRDHGGPCFGLQRTVANGSKRRGCYSRIEGGVIGEAEGFGKIRRREKQRRGG